MTSSFRNLTVDCHDPYAIGSFWQQLLDGYAEDPDEPNNPEDPEFFLVGPGPNVLFIKVPEPKSVKNRLHLDLSPTDRTRDEEVDRLEALGAILVDDRRNPDGSGWAVMTDPEGNEFCVVRSQAEYDAAESLPALITLGEPMTTDLISRGLAAASDTSVVEVGRGVLAASGTILRDSLFAGGRAALVVADDRTWEAAGKAVHESLVAAGVEVLEPMIFPGHPVLYAAFENCDLVRERLASTGALGVAVGSGTLNDLTKLASGQLGQTYAVVGTAASMDGYSGFGAPMSSHGVKVTMPCPAPQVVIIDLDVAAAAPPSMVASGYGDLSAKIPAGADWILSDAVGLDPIDPLAWELVQSGVSDALSQPHALAARDPDAYAGLVSGLVLSGLAMQVYRGTRPASGAEHYFSHLWELDHLGADLDPPLSHGAKVAIGTLAMSAFYERFLLRDLAALDIDAAVAEWAPWDVVEADIRSRFTGALADHAVTETKVKYVDGAGLRTRLERFGDTWDALQPRITAQLVPAKTLQAMLRSAGAPATPEDIGLTAEDVRATFPRAMYYRSRYTVLDLAREANWFDELVDEVFAPGGLWT